MGEFAQGPPVRSDDIAGSQDEIEDLRARLAEAEDTIRAIYHGEVDAVVVNAPSGPRVYTLEGADHPYRVLVEQIQEATVTLDRDNLILYANPQFAALTQSNPDETAGSDFGRFLGAVDSNLFAALVEGASVRGHSSGEIHLKTAHREALPVRVSITLLSIPQVETMCVVITDLREQRRNESLIREEQLSRLILDQAGEAIVVIDPQGIIVRRSESAKILADGPMLLTHFDRKFQLDSGGMAVNSRRILGAATAGEQIRGLEVSMLHYDGRRSSLLISSSPLWNDGKQLLGCVITLTNFTQRKLAEEALARQAGELARSNGDLRQFAYSASHDLREPLRQVRLFSELLEKKYDGELDEEARRLIHHTVDCARRMEDQLQGLLAYTQAADAPHEVTTPTDPNEVLHRTLEVFESQIAESGARIDCDPMPLLRVHELHLNQLFQNLISNALKYRGDKQPVIRISAERAEGMLRISVADNGIGVAPEYQTRIFGLFQRLHGGDKYAGSGIGLAICQKIVQRYDGVIWVESELGKGSRFLFTLPEAKSD